MFTPTEVELIRILLISEKRRLQGQILKGRIELRERLKEVEGLLRKLSVTNVTASN
jgi:hypothetical protein